MSVFANNLSIKTKQIDLEVFVFQGASALPYFLSAGQELIDYPPDETLFIYNNDDYSNVPVNEETENYNFFLLRDNITLSGLLSKERFLNSGQCIANEPMCNDYIGYATRAHQAGMDRETVTKLFLLARAWDEKHFLNCMDTDITNIHRFRPEKDITEIGNTRKNYAMLYYLSIANESDEKTLEGKLVQLINTIKVDGVEGKIEQIQNIRAYSMKCFTTPIFKEFAHFRFLLIWEQSCKEGLFRGKLSDEEAQVKLTKHKRRENKWEKIIFDGTPVYS